MNHSQIYKWFLVKIATTAVPIKPKVIKRIIVNVLVIYNLFICWSCDRGTFSNYATELGLKGTLSAAEAQKAFMGASAPKPGIASAQVNGVSISSGYDPSKKGDLIASEVGWSLTEPIILMASAPAPAP